VRGGKTGHCVNVRLPGAEPGGKIFPPEMPCRAIAAGKGSQPVAQDVRSAVPQHHADLQPFGRIG
jgi:hypothetical protein